MRNLDLLKEEVQNYIEWLETTEGDEVECISIENLETILRRFFGTEISLSENVTEPDDKNLNYPHKQLNLFKDDES